MPVYSPVSCTCRGRRMLCSSWGGRLAGALCSSQGRRHGAVWLVLQEQRVGEACVTHRKSFVWPAANGVVVHMCRGWVAGHVTPPCCSHHL
jgi:hypothetical protein